MTKTLRAALMAAGCGLLAPCAHADWVFRVHNESGVEAKGVVQNVQVVWLKRGQVNDIRVVGRWDKNFKNMYVVNFENLANAGDQYCVWEVSYYGSTYAGGPAGNASGDITITPKLVTQKPGFLCEVAGQLHIRYGDKGTNDGATQDYYLRQAKK